jgi:hypothetical protein
VAALIPSGPNFFGTCVARHLGGCAALLDDSEKPRLITPRRWSCAARSVTAPRSLSRACSSPSCSSTITQTSVPPQSNTSTLPSASSAT